MLIKRNYYLNKITPFIGKAVIKVITGQRRAGKSSILKLLSEELKHSGEIFYIDKELYKFDNIKSYKDLIEYVENKNKDKMQCTIFIDEIQDINEFEKALRHFLACNIYDIYCSGSNSKLLSGELSTLLSGRYVEFRIYTLTYKEFLEFHGLKKSNESLNSYLKYGGLPFLRNINLEEEIVREYINGIYKTVLLKDIIERYNVRNPQFLEKLAHFCADNTGSIVSAKSISNYLKSQNVKTSPNTVLDYLQYFVNACLMQKAKRFDIKGKKLLETGEKYYFEDIGIRNHISKAKVTDINKILENAVYHHLCASGYNVYIGSLNNLEIDFICEKNNETVYIQVCYLLENESTIEREFGNLKKIKNDYPKFVVSMDPQFSGTVEGIRHVEIQNFLLNFPFKI